MGVVTGVRANATRDALNYVRPCGRSGVVTCEICVGSCGVEEVEAALAEVEAVERVVEAARRYVGMDDVYAYQWLVAALAELDGQTPEADTSAGEAPAGRPSASGACPCRVHGDPDGDCGERCA